MHALCAQCPTGASTSTPLGTIPATTEGWPGPAAQRPRPLRHRLQPVHVLRDLRRGCAPSTPSSGAHSSVRRIRPARPAPRRTGWGWMATVPPATGPRWSAADPAEVTTANRPGGLMTCSTLRSAPPACSRSSVGCSPSPLATSSMPALWLVVARCSASRGHCSSWGPSWCRSCSVVYVGAIVVLVLFALMVTRADRAGHRLHPSVGPRRIGVAPQWRRRRGAPRAVLVPSLGAHRVGPSNGPRSARRRWPRTSSACGSGPSDLSLLLLAALVAASPNLPDSTGRDGSALVIPPVSPVVPGGRSSVWASWAYSPTPSRPWSSSRQLHLSGGLVLLVTSGLVGGAAGGQGPVSPQFVITIAAAETVVALAIIHLFRHRRRIDLDDGGEP